MANIILEPGETFEHYHEQESVTTLLEGDVVFECGEKTLQLKIGDPIFVPPKTAHKLKNCGLSEAKINCGGHGGQ